MSFAGLNTAQNLSFYSIPVAFVLSLAPHAYAMSLYNKERAPGTPEFDMTRPGANQSNLKDAKLSPNASETFLRAEAAQVNGFIGLPFFAGAVVAGNMARLTPTTLNVAVGIYLVSRALYNLIYISNTTPMSANLRTASWLTGIVTCLTLYVQAGNRMRTGYAGY